MVRVILVLLIFICFGENNAVPQEKMASKESYREFIKLSYSVLQIDLMIPLIDELVANTLKEDIPGYDNVPNETLISYRHKKQVIAKYYPLYRDVIVKYLKNEKFILSFFDIILDVYELKLPDEVLRFAIKELHNPILKDISAKNHIIIAKFLRELPLLCESMVALIGAKNKKIQEGFDSVKRIFSTKIADYKVTNPASDEQLEALIKLIVPEGFMKQLMAELQKQGINNPQGNLLGSFLNDNQLSSLSSKASKETYSAQEVEYMIAYYSDKEFSRFLQVEGQKKIGDKEVLEMKRRFEVLFSPVLLEISPLNNKFLKEWNTVPKALGKVGE